MGAKETMRMTPRFVIRLPRATFLMATLAVLSLLAVTPAAKAQPFTQINIGAVLNFDENVAFEYNGDFRTGSVVNQSSPPPNMVAGPPGLTFSIPTSGPNIYSTAIGAPVVGSVTSPTIGIGVLGVTTVYALVNSIAGTLGQTDTFTFNGTGTIIGGVKQPGTSRIFLAGLVVSGAVPEPGPIALAAVAGLAGLVGYGRRYRGMVAGWFNREPKVG